MIAADMTISRTAVAPYRAPDGTILVELQISNRTPALMTIAQAMALSLELLVTAIQNDPAGQGEIPD